MHTFATVVFAACIPYHTIPYHTIPYHTISYHTIPYHAISCHTISVPPLHYITFSTSHRTTSHYITSHYTRTYEHECIYIHTYTYMHACMRAYIPTHTPITYMQTANIHKRRHRHRHACIHTSCTHTLHARMHCVVLHRVVLHNVTPRYTRMRAFIHTYSCTRRDPTPLPPKKRFIVLLCTPLLSRRAVLLAAIFDHCALGHREGLPVRFGLLDLLAKQTSCKLGLLSVKAAPAGDEWSETARHTVRRGHRKGLVAQTDQKRGQACLVLVCVFDNLPLNHITCSTYFLTARGI